MSAPFDGFEHRRFGAHELPQRNAVRACHLCLIGFEACRSASPDNHRRHAKSGMGYEIIKHSDDAAARQRKPDLFLKFTKCSFFRRFARIDDSTGQCPLPRMLSKLRRSSSKQHGGLTAPLTGRLYTRNVSPHSLIEDRQCYRCPLLVAGAPRCASFPAGQRGVNF